MDDIRAERLNRLPRYLFVEIDRLKEAALRAGRDVIDLGVGDPDLPTPAFIVSRMREAVADAAHHRYPSTRGSSAFRQAAARFLQRRFDLSLDPDRQILSLIGTKEGIGHLPLALVNPGDVVLVPDPGYPVYRSGAVLAGADVHSIPLKATRGFLPALDEIPTNVARRARLMWLNYPNNPTSVEAPPSFFEEAVAFARQFDLTIAQDAAYSEVYTGKPPASILQVPGGLDVAVELHSLSKTFNMTGWRVGFAAGRAEALAALAEVKNNLDSGVFGAIQEAAITALDGFDRPEVREIVQTYRRRRRVLVDALIAAGWWVQRSGATFYVWARCPEGEDSASTARRLLEEAAVVAIPGRGFGESGEGYVRFALTVAEERLAEAGRRIGRIRW